MSDYSESIRILGSLDDFLLKSALITLKPLHDSLILELLICRKLVEGYHCISLHDFKQAVLNYYFAKSSIEKWIELGTHNPPLLRFLRELTSLLYSKIGLCFHKVITPKDVQAMHFSQPKVRFHDEIRAAYLKPVLDIYDSLKPINISLLYVPLPGSRFKHGFECEGTDFTLPSGIRSFPAVCSFPQEDAPFEFLPSIVSLLYQHANSPQKPNFVLYDKKNAPSLVGECDFPMPIAQCFVFYDSTLKVSFVLCQLDSHYIFAMVYAQQLAKQSESLLQVKLKDFYGSFDPLDKGNYASIAKNVI